MKFREQAGVGLQTVSAHGVRWYPGRWFTADREHLLEAQDVEVDLDRERAGDGSCMPEEKFFAAPAAC
jgi:hypothetical protein